MWRNKIPSENIDANKIKSTIRNFNSTQNNTIIIGRRIINSNVDDRKNVLRRNKTQLGESETLEKEKMFAMLC